MKRFCFGLLAFLPLGLVLPALDSAHALADVFPSWS